MEAGLPIFPRCLAGFMGRVRQEGDRERSGKGSGPCPMGPGGIDVPVYSPCYHLPCIAVEHVLSKRKCVCDCVSACVCVCVGNMQSSG